MGDGHEHGAAAHRARCFARCFAHRGARAYLPENTLEAFALGLDLGGDAIECDVQRSKDGALVIIHDGTVDRTTTGHGLVSTHTLAELRATRARPNSRVRTAIPTVEETLELVVASGGQVNFEVKGETSDEAIGTARALGEFLRHVDSERRARVLVSSFDLAALAEVRRRVPGLQLGALFDERHWRGQDVITPARELGAVAVHPELRLVTKRLIEDTHAAGLAINVWTVNQPQAIERLLALGVDGIFSDYPERVVVARARAAAFPLG